MRNIYIVNAAQVVISENHPEGLYSTISGYPKTYDSNSYNGDSDTALRAAKAEYFSRLSANYAGSANRVMAAITLETAQGRVIMSECIGAFPIVPEPGQE